MNQNLPVHQLTSDLASSADQGRIKATTHVMVGAFLGLTWGCALRAWMVLLTLQLGDWPNVTWRGTFAGVLLPATLLGALIGHAISTAKISGRKCWRLVLVSPLLLVLGAAIGQSNFISTLLATGMGGGAIGVALVGMLGGYALSGLGRRWTRGMAALLGVLLLAATIIPVYSAGTSSAFPFRAHKVLSILLFILLMVLLVVGISAPFRTRSR